MRPSFAVDRTWLVTLALLVSLSACADRPPAAMTELELPVPNVPLPPAVRAGEPLQTDSLSYTATYVSGEGAYKRYGFRVVTHFTNRRSTPVYLASCYAHDTSPVYGVPVYGDTTASGRQTSIFSPIWPCVGHDRQLEVQPGATRTDTILVIGPNSYSNATQQPNGIFDARVHLRFRVQTCRGDYSCTLPSDEGLSNAFDVRVIR